MNIDEKLVVRKECPICGSKKVSQIYFCPINKEPILGYLNWRLPGYFRDPNVLIFDYVLLRCEKCEGVFHKIVRKETYNEFGSWRDAYEVIWNKHRKKMYKDVPLVFVREINLIKYILGKMPDKCNLLDFGCGWGTWCQVAKAFGFNVYGIEIDQAKRQYVMKNNIPLLDLDKIDDLKFDFINVEQGFEHFHYPLEILTRLASYLNDSGLIRISVPNGRYILKALQNENNWQVKKKTGKNTLNPVWPFEHINSFTSKSLEIMGKKTRLTRFRLSFFQYVHIQRRCMQLIHALGRAYNHSISSTKTQLYFIKDPQ